MQADLACAEAERLLGVGCVLEKVCARLTAKAKRAKAPAFLAAALSLALSPPAAAQQLPASPEETPTVTVTEAPVDPARLAVARVVVDLILPPGTREQMIDSVAASQSEIMRQGFTSNPQFAKAFGSDPRIKEAFDGFINRMSERSRAETRAMLPNYSEALSRAYARRFELKQLEDIRAFYETPTGHVYSHISVLAMSDPDVVAWQRSVMARSLSHFQQDVSDFARQAAAIQADRCARANPCKVAK